MATDPTDQSTVTHNYQVNVTAGSPRSYTRDENGNITGSSSSDGSGLPNTTYEWNAADRLTVVNIGTHRTELEYDGLGRRSHLTEKDDGTVTSEKRFLWCGNELCEERNPSGGTVTKRFFAQGEERIGGADAGIYFYTRDHLGSVREMTDTGGNVRARYDYTPWGSRVKIEGDLDCDFGFTGFYSHAPSGLNFSRTRVYDPVSAKWLSRDPIGERGGINLYGYTGNNSVNFTDPLGLTWSSNITFLLSWVSGQGSNSRNYNLSSVETREMQDSPGADALRDAFYKTDCRGVENFPYGSGRAAWDTLINRWTADWSSTSAQVGGFAGATAVNNGDGTVTFTIPNSAGTYSLFYHMVPDRSGTTGPMRNIKQTFTWTEPIGP